MHGTEETKTNTYTPGPWALDADLMKIYSVPTNLMIAAIPISRNPTCEQAWEMDSRLIAAAPEMFEALRGIVLAFGLGSDLDDKIDVAITAIAKARGEG